MEALMNIQKKLRHPLVRPQPQNPLRNRLTSSERPRERCLQQGAHALSLRECLAVILGSGPLQQSSLGLASTLLARVLGLTPDDTSAESEHAEGERALFTALENSGSDAFQHIPGLRPAAQARLLAAFELGRRYTHYRLRPLQPLPIDVDALSIQILEKVPAEFRGQAQEGIGFVAIHRNGELSELCIVERGVRTHVNFDPAELFARVLALRPAGFALIHNHPSGSPYPSPDDLILTQRVEHLARKLGLRLVGHGIVSSHGSHWLRP